MHSDYVARHSLHKVGVGGLCLHDDKILFVKHTYGVSKGQWTLPGGYCELGESLTQAIEREVFEETGVSTRATELIAVRHMTNEKINKGLISDVYIVFNLEYKEGNLSFDNFEISGSKFIPVQELGNYDISGLSKFIVEQKTGKKGFASLNYLPSEEIKEKLNVHTYQVFG